MNKLSPISSMTDTPDLAERRRALDPSHSFIVQAPAGSGKTGLLIQRYLKLLTCVNEPEEIIAITFTRKAAGEMRERVIGALAQAGSKLDPLTLPETEHQKLTRELADAAVRRDAEAGWRLAENPARLRIQTFDSLCASLSRQMPILSEFGCQPETLEDASDLYREAARTVIHLVDSNEVVMRDIECLLEHLDNDMARVESLLAEMLARRDHWLRHIHGRDRDELEAALRNTRQDALRHLRSLFQLHPESMQDELVQLMRYAACNLAASGRNSIAMNYEQFGGLCVLPRDEEQDYACWYAIAELLLTRDGAWRKQHTINDGFPTVTKGRKDIAKEWKERACTLVSSLAAHENGNTLCRALHDVRLLPPSCYTEKQWEVLGSIMRLLPRAVAQLRLVFQVRSKVDFTEVSQGALRSLGEPEMPTDLALALDYRIRHLLIDEFQDTSISQYELVTRLTSGWEAGDGRSMLIVGDPMQSIYGFREAEVGLFLRARAAGIGDITLHPISLSANFRSQRGIVDWVNITFARIMPKQEDIALGATPYIPSASMHGLLDGAAVGVHPFFDDDHTAEATRVVEIALQAQKNDPSATMAILVRNRSHLREIAPRLRNAGLKFRAIDIEGLAFRPVVQDLLALTRALTHPGDRLAWLALLRAPWCGLTLADIHALVSTPAPVPMDQSGMSGDTEPTGSGTRDQTIWEVLNDASRIATISTDGQARLRRVREELRVCLDNRYRQSLRETVEAAWLALGGPACVDGLADLEDAAAYLDHLEAHEDAGNAGIRAVEEGLTKLYALPDLKADGRLQIMTIHKAKGLEFDYVILPGLGRSSRSNDKKLFMWMERLRARSSPSEASCGNDLLLAPIQETGADGDRIYAWLEKMDNEKERLEDERLLYVAATRARKRLHLLGSTSVFYSRDGEHELRPPARKSLLSKIWPAVQPIYEKAAVQAVSSQPSPVPHSPTGKESGRTGEYPIDQSLRRLVSGWALPAAPPATKWKAQQPASSTRGDIEYSWAGERARHIGNIVHRWLRCIAEDGLETWNTARIQDLRDTVRHQLMAGGMYKYNRETDVAADRIITALTHAVSDTRGRWLLGSQQDACNELCMTAVIDGQPRDLVIDRTFCDAHGQRWVVDYKTSSHEGADLEGFLSREQERYRAQLDRYAELMHRVDNKPVKRGLYFPLLRGWREWEDEVRK
ncbi:UvrD-helicase domain-containing protein [Nitrosovibrio tenuis]|uniref:DNA 3'-5' helicase n=1 Tax=Nitrosovibrio tenuis TaxID=1233 RepID=A0A1H7H4I8_9PROT|nr:UvrD-helicase domain-containing protein [Nitrosovibrio tenuis]SEK45333.1 ATP-dependent exoDNAse (exonuclease V) beta subunit (contains helicase and exonuclease domains) [Nitrosovibrio tenuis]